MSAKRSAEETDRQADAIAVAPAGHTVTRAEFPVRDLNTVLGAVPSPARFGCRVSYFSFRTAEDDTLITEVQLTVPAGWTVVVEMRQAAWTLLGEDGSEWDARELADQVHPTAPEDFTDFIGDLHSTVTAAMGTLPLPELLAGGLTTSLHRALNRSDTATGNERTAPSGVSGAA